jgi:hypothetical protein
MENRGALVRLRRIKSTIAAAPISALKLNVGAVTLAACATPAVIKLVVAFDAKHGLVLTDNVDSLRGRREATGDQADRDDDDRAHRRCTMASSRYVLESFAAGPAEHLPPLIVMRVVFGLGFGFTRSWVTPRTTSRVGGVIFSCCEKVFSKLVPSPDRAFAALSTSLEGATHENDETRSIEI